jgi:transcriptional regulator with XRE-family HTH domain
MRKPRSDSIRHFYAAVGQKISQIRQGKEITQEALAAEISVTRTSIVNIERGKQQILLHTLIRIAKALNVDPHELLPEQVPTEQSVLEVINTLVPDPKGRSWMERVVKSTKEN